jgi:hypothetical protein
MMAGQWEILAIDVYNIYICTPKEAEVISILNFIQKHPRQVIKQEPALGDKYWVAVCLILSDGWEPYALDGHSRSFRRKYQG